MRRNKGLFIVCLLVVVVLSIGMVSCKKTEIEIKDNLIENIGDKIEGLSAYEIASEAFINWQTNVFPNHERIEELNFSVNNGSLATRRAKQIYKVNNGSIWSEQVTINSGLAGANYAVKLIYDANNEAGYAWVLKGNKLVPGKGEDIYEIESWGEHEKKTMQENQDEIEEFKKSYRKMITTYDVSSRDYLDDTHSDEVYTYAPDPTKYICTLTIDMSLDAQKTVQKVAKEEFENALGAKEDSIKMQPVTITFLIEKYNDTYRVLKWVSTEVYTGYRLGTQSCEQSYTASFSYEEEDYTFSTAVE